MKIYLAAPWFSPEQRRIHDEVLMVLDSTEHKIFSPMRELVVQPNDPEPIRRKAFQGNLRALDECDVVVAITDYKDIGTIWEAGYAYRALKAIVYYAETLGDRPFNLMLAQSGFGVVRSTTELASVMRATNISQLKRTCDEHAYKGKVE